MLRPPAFAAHRLESKSPEHPIDELAQVGPSAPLLDAASQVGWPTGHDFDPRPP